MDFHKGNKMIKFIDPRGESSTSEQSYDLSHDIRINDGDGVTVALLANGFPDSELFIKKVGLALKKRLPRVETMLWNKKNAGVAVSDEMLDAMFPKCDVAVAAYGH